MAMEIQFMHKLPHEFYNRNTRLVAMDLLGYCLVHVDKGIKKIGRIVEVEAYLGNQDLASHSSKGLTKRTSIMFGPPGFAYVYMIYGKYYCLNVVTEPQGVGAAVLIRAIEPLANLCERTRGPGLLCQSMGIDTKLNGQDLISNELFITENEYKRPDSIVKTPRIGIAYAKEWADSLLRFYIDGNPFVSCLKKSRYNVSVK